MDNLTENLNVIENNSNDIQPEKNSSSFKRNLFPLFLFILLIVTVGFTRTYFTVQEPDYEFLQKMSVKIDQKILTYQEQKNTTNIVPLNEPFFEPILNSFGGNIQIDSYNTITGKYNLKITHVPIEFCNSFSLRFSNQKYMTKINEQIVKPFSQEASQRSGSFRQHIKFIEEKCNLPKNDIIILNKSINQKL